MRKKIYKIMMMTVLGAAVLMPSCKKNFQEINTDPNGTPNALPQQLLAPALVNTLTVNMLRNRNFNNELMQVSVDASDAEGRVFRYDFRRSFADNTWNGWYTQLLNFKDIYDIASQPLTLSKTYQGISLICQAWLFSLLTDTYGDVPYSQALQGKDGNFTPAFDKQKDIYLDLFNKLEQANTLLTGSANVLSASDPVFNGNASKWQKFGNSLYLRLLLRVSGKADVRPMVVAKIKQMVDTSPATYPVMAGNDDSAVIRWTGQGYLTSPFVTNVREQDWRAPDVAEFFLNNLINWQDPRLTPTNRWGIATYMGGYAGTPSGYAPGTPITKKSYFLSNLQVTSTTPNTLYTDPLTGNIMNYAELQFILSEAALKGFISNNTADNYYKAGALAAITFWVPTYTGNIDSYLTAADINFKPAQSLDTKMELIHLQKYYAMFFTDFEQWFEYRRTGHPILPKGPGLRNNGVMPGRIQYPAYVQSANPTNYQNAVTSQGPDEISTLVWWQKP